MRRLDLLSAAGISMIISRKNLWKRFIDTGGAILSRTKFGMIKRNFLVFLQKRNDEFYVKVAGDMPKSERSLGLSFDEEKMGDVWEPIKDWPSFLNEKMPAKYNEWLNNERTLNVMDYDEEKRITGGNFNSSYRNLINLRDSHDNAKIL